MNEKEILDLAFAAFENGTDCKIKLPPANEIHAFNMAVNSLIKSGYIEIYERSLTNMVFGLTETGLELYM